MKRGKWFIFFGLLFGVLLAPPATDGTDKGAPSYYMELACQLGEIDGATSAEGLAFRGDTIEVEQQELSRLIDKKILTGQRDPEQNAIDFLLRREALYHLILSKGYEASDADVQARIQMMKDIYAQDNVGGKEYVDSYLKGMGLTADEYFESQYEIYKKELTTALYLDNVMYEFLEKQGLEYGTSEAIEVWRPERNRIADEYIAKDNVVDLR